MNKSNSNLAHFADSEANELRQALLVQFIKEGFGISAGGRKFKPNDEFWRWIDDIGDRNPFGYEQSCKALGYNADYLRYLLKKRFNSKR